MNKVLLFVFTLLIINVSLTAQQRSCNTMDHLEMELKENPKRIFKMEQIQKQLNEYMSNLEDRSAQVHTIPVVVHVVYNNNSQNISNSQIQSQMTVLNDDFRRLNADANNTWPQAADIELDFCLASVDPSGNTTTGITRTQTNVTTFTDDDKVKFTNQGGQNAWNTQKYLNIWVCKLDGFLGYAQFPGGNSATDGVVCDYQAFGTNGTANAPFNEGRTATHEVGHWLNLYHIWGDGGCNVDDEVADTPESDAPNYGCASNHSSCGSVDMVQNYMDYSDDACMNLFTQGQKTRMRALFANNGFRNGLLSSNGCGDGGNNPTCNDGVQNGDETGVDCGGSDCPPCNSVCSDNEFNLIIVPDDYGSETTWEIKSGNNVLYAGGPYTDGNSNPISVDLCLADGCYDFVINDSYGDGICCDYGNGSFEITDDQGNVVVTGGSFGSTLTENFCASGGNDPGDADAGVRRIVRPLATQCNPTFKPRVQIKNYGTVALTSVDIKYRTDNNPYSSFSWTGNLDPGKFKTIILPKETFPTGSHSFDAYTENPNGAGDINPNNDDKSKNFAITGDVIKVQIKPDQYGSDITWELVNENNDIILSGGPYPDGNQSWKIKSICAPVDCYTFKIYDSYGDGICCDSGNGKYRIKNSAGATLISSNGQYGSFEEQDFCTDGSARVGSPYRDEKVNKRFNVFPNPTNGIVHVQFESLDEEVEVAVYNMLGQKITSTLTSNSVASFDLQSKQAGMYIVRIENDVRQETQKFMLVNQ